MSAKAKPTLFLYICHKSWSNCIIFYARKLGCFWNMSTKFGSLSCNISEDIGRWIWVKTIAVAKPGTSNFDGYGITCIFNNYYQQIKTIICLMTSKSMDWFPFEMIVALKRAVWLSCISHSWCSKWPPSARTHARRRGRLCWQRRRWFLDQSVPIPPSVVLCDALCPVFWCGTPGSLVHPIFCSRLGWDQDCWVAIATEWWNH